MIKSILEQAWKLCFKLSKRNLEETINGWKRIKKEIDYLFDRFWDEDLTDEEQEKLEQDSKDLVVKYGWKAVYSAATEYLHTKCKTPESVFNFASNYWTYGWHDYSIPDPY